MPDFTKCLEPSKQLFQILACIWNWIPYPLSGCMLSLKPNMDNIIETADESHKLWDYVLFILVQLLLDYSGVMSW